MPLDHVIFGTFLEQIYLLSLYDSVCFSVLMYMYMFMFVMYCDFHSAHIFIVYNSVIVYRHSIFYFIIVKLY